MSSYFNFRCRFHGDCSCHDMSWHLCDKELKCHTLKEYPGGLQKLLMRAPETRSSLLMHEALNIKTLLYVINLTSVSKLYLNFLGQSTLIRRAYLYQVTHLSMTTFMSIAEWTEMKGRAFDMNRNQESMRNILISAEVLKFLHISFMNIQALTWQRICLALNNPKLEILHLGKLLFDSMDFQTEAGNFVTSLVHSKVKCLTLCWDEGCEMLPKIVFELLNLRPEDLPLPTSCLTIQAPVYRPLIRHGTKLILKNFTLYYVNLNNPQEGKYMIDFIRQIQADKIRIVEKLSDRYSVGGPYEVTNIRTYRKLKRAYRQVIEYARSTLGEQFDKIKFYNHENRLIKSYK